MGHAQALPSPPRGHHRSIWRVPPGVLRQTDTGLDSQVGHQVSARFLPPRKDLARSLRSTGQMPESDVVPNSLKISAFNFSIFSPSAGSATSIAPLSEKICAVASTRRSATTKSRSSSSSSLKSTASWSSSPSPSSSPGSGRTSRHARPSGAYVALPRRHGQGIHPLGCSVGFRSLRGHQVCKLSLSPRNVGYS